MIEATRKRVGLKENTTLPELKTKLLKQPAVAPLIRAKAKIQSAETGMKAVRKNSPALVEKWGRESIEAGFTALPNAIFRQQKALDLKHLDVLIILHLASYWWTAASSPWPAKGTIATALDVDPRTVQRSVARMEALGYVKRTVRKAKVGDNLPNEYNLNGLVRAVSRLSAAELKINASRDKEDKKRISTPNAFALGKRR